MGNMGNRGKGTLVDILVFVLVATFLRNYPNYACM